MRLLASRSGRLGLTDVASSLGLARGTAHGILRTLQLVGFVEQDKESGKYQLGAALLHLGTSYLDVNELRSRAINWADPLAARSGEAVRLGTLLDRQVLDRPPRIPAGRHIAGSRGRLVAARTRLRPRQGVARLRLPNGGRRRRRPAWIATPGGPRDTPKDLNRALLLVREHGWAAEVEELHPGEAAIAAPIRGYGGLVVGALGISGPVERVCDGSGEPRVGLVGYVTERGARSLTRPRCGSVVTQSAKQW